MTGRLQDEARGGKAARRAAARLVTKGLPSRLTSVIWEQGKDEPYDYWNCQRSLKILYGL